MTGQEIAQLIFQDSEDFEAFLEKDNALDVYESVWRYGMSTKKFLYLDHRGEQHWEIVNYLLDYEFTNHIELGTQEELEELGEFEYEYVPEKIREANKLLSPKGYGLFSYPTGGDFYALFIAKLEKKEKLLQVEVFDDERIPAEGRFIQFYD